MKLISLSAILVLLAASFIAGKQPGETVVVTPSGSACEITFPSKPREIKTKYGMQYLLERFGGKGVLMLHFDTLPKATEIGNTEAVKVRLDAGRDSLLKHFKGSTLVSEKDLIVDKKYPARDLDVKLPAAGAYRVRTIMTGPHLYQVTVVGPPEYHATEEAKQFAASFRFKD